MSKEDFVKTLNERTLIADGAMGTMLYQSGAFINTCFDHINLTDPELICGIHRKYIDAGADIIETNTFGANSLKLSRFGLGDLTEKINKAAVEIARDAIGDREVFIAGSVGPSSAEVTESNFEQIKNIFIRHIKSLYDANVDLLMLETFTNPIELKAAILAVGQVCDLPIVAQMSLVDQNETYYGNNISDVFTEISHYQHVSSVGLNCSLGPAGMLKALDVIRNLTDKPIAIQPNAGLPQEVDGRSIYMSTPEYMAEYSKRFFEKGVSIIGGCCGTTPEHIKQISQTIISMDKAYVKSEGISKFVIADKPEDVETVAFEKKSCLAEKISKNEKVYCIEISPPKGTDLRKIIEKVDFCKCHGIDAINIPDGPRASSRLSAFATAIKIQQSSDIETLLHVCCRDKNLIAMQSDMLGMQAIGIKNVLLVTGDPPKLGQYPNATGVFDLDSVELTKVVRNLNHGIDISGSSFSGQLSLTIGVGLNPVSSEPQREIERFRQKVEAGAEYAITQPVFDSKLFIEFMDRIKDFKIPIIAGIWPLTSYKNAEFMANEVPGVYLPEDVLSRMKKVKTREEGIKEGVLISQEMMADIDPFVDGYAVSAPFGNVKIALAVLGKIAIEEIF